MQNDQQFEKKTGWKNFLSVLKEKANIHEDSDIESTVLNIQKDVEFKGVNIWILAFAIIVASVGLNVNSTAVIIGAMLISPLMGPITGIGLAIGTNDFDLLRKSLVNLGIMVGISLTASTAYFLVSPLSDAQSELLARTTPTIFDVFIAFFGGLAGIVASSRKGGKFTVVAGVAIATALMPPLCTTGYGLATGQFNFFFGAFYLFLINSFFIALATFLMVRYLRFPKKIFMDPKRERRVKQSIMFFSILTMVPSVIVALYVVRESSFNSRAIRFVEDLNKSVLLDQTFLTRSEKHYGRKESTLSLTFVGQQLSEKEIMLLNNKLRDYKLDNTRLIIKQSGGELNSTGFADFSQVNAILQRAEDRIAYKDSIIVGLKKELNRSWEKKNDMQQIAKEIRIQYPGIKRFAMVNALYYHPHAITKDTIPTLLLTADKKINREQLKEWLKIRLGLNRIYLEEQPE